MTNRIIPGSVLRNVTLPNNFVFSYGSEFGPNSVFTGSNLPQNTILLPPKPKSTGRMMVPIQQPNIIGMSMPNPVPLYGYDGRMSPRHRHR